jgi:hypothetical protein
MSHAGLFEAPAEAAPDHRSETGGHEAEQGKLFRALNPLKKGLAKLKCRNTKGAMPCLHHNHHACLIFLTSSRPLLLRRKKPDKLCHRVKSLRPIYLCWSHSSRRRQHRVLGWACDLSRTSTRWQPLCPKSMVVQHVWNHRPRSTPCRLFLYERSSAKGLRQSWQNTLWPALCRGQRRSRAQHPCCSTCHRD